MNRIIESPDIILFFLMAIAIGAVALAYYLWGRRRNPGASAFAFVNLSIAIWCIGYLLELGLPELSGKMLGVKIQYTFGIPFVSVFFFFGALDYKTRGRRPTSGEQILMLIIPIFTMLFMWTNDLFSLVYINERIVHSGRYLFLEKEWGMWYYVNIVYSYIALGGGAAALLLSLKNLQKLYKLQTIFIVFGVVIPWFTNLIYLLGSSSFMRFDLTVFGFAAGNAIIGLALFKYELFEVIPAAREIVFESFDNGVIVADNYDRIVDINPAAIRIFGMRGLVGGSVLDLLDEFGIGHESIRSGGNSKHEIMIDEKTFDLIISPVFDKQNRLNGSVLFFHEITNLKRIQKELAESNNTKDKFFSIIAHDLKNPFFSLIGLSEILIKDFSDLTDDEKMKISSSINELAINTHRMLENLLEWSRQQTGRIEFHPKSINITRLIEENIKQASQPAMLKKIRFIKHDFEPVFVFADENMINTVLRNLISNAIKFTKPGGEISVSVSQNSESAMVSVKDTGIGMDGEILTKLFKIEHDVKSIGTSGEKGTGLGLLLCKEFVEKNGGEIKAQSSPGSGSEFFITLPKSKT